VSRFQRALSSGLTDGGENFGLPRWPALSVTRMIPGTNYCSWFSSLKRLFFLNSTNIWRLNVRDASRKSCTKLECETCCNLNNIGNPFGGSGFVICMQKQGRETLGNWIDAFSNILFRTWQDQSVPHRKNAKSPLQSPIG
jgi:hypothetical protein